MSTVFDESGHIIEVDTATPVNDLTRAPKFMEEMPGGVMFVPVVIPAADGVTPRIALVNPTLIATTKEVTDRIVAAVNKARQEFVDAGITRDEVQQTQINSLATQTARIDGVIAAQNTLIAQLQARKQFIALPDVTIPAASLVSALATEKVFTMTCTGLRTTDTVTVTPKSLPVGYGLRSWSVAQNDQIVLRVQAPILSLGGSAIVFGVSVFR